MPSHHWLQVFRVGVPGALPTHPQAKSLPTCQPTPQVPTYSRAPFPSSCTTRGPFVPTEDWPSERLADSLQPRRYAWSIL